MLSKVFRLDSYFYVFVYGEGLNWETFDKNTDNFKILIESKTNLKVTYKDNDQFN